MNEGVSRAKELLGGPSHVPSANSSAFSSHALASVRCAVTRERGGRIHNGIVLARARKTRRDKPLEQSHPQRRSLREVLRMPLNTDHESGARVLDRFDGPI